MFRIANSIPRCALQHPRVATHAQLLAKYVLKTEYYTEPCYVYVIKGRTVLDKARVFHEGDVLVTKQAASGLEGAYNTYEFNTVTN